MWLSSVNIIFLRFCVTGILHNCDLVVSYLSSGLAGKRASWLIPLPLLERAGLEFIHALFDGSRSDVASLRNNEAKVLSNRSLGTSATPASSGILARPAGGGCALRSESKERWPKDARSSSFFLFLSTTFICTRISSAERMARARRLRTYLVRCSLFKGIQAGPLVRFLYSFRLKERTINRLYLFSRHFIFL